ncbi:MAG: nicotinamide-nucleotide amidase [Gammaproteobacteria bacterium]|nr:nicotinamide-nucleotide amidase [Gammaproteobacteria bacterium]
MEKEVMQISQQLLSIGSLLTTAESCTGGWVAKMITDMPGSSQWFDRGFVTYSNASKTDMLSVSVELLANYGAVSEQVAASMAVGALNNSLAEYSLSITGVAGPDGGSPEKPVGMVCFGWAKKNTPAMTETVVFEGDRDRVRYQAAKYALEGLLNKYLK